ncbi:uncharacterized protein N7496_008559 [Penicillium cataractarum]|uniref:Uncharacterized protein n=1 Tax=Penicillium cataractarum TaxID=2100454 RepID=A0A9W9V5V5_9EURO|nr:uncharacterized protein N7496_008559 [Penicillium cataractarum]KAJ5368799.1 hypothetical protein N7496_008559 [Penicillium cataractarum]
MHRHLHDHDHLVVAQTLSIDGGPGLYHPSHTSIVIHMTVQDMMYGDHQSQEQSHTSGVPRMNVPEET